MTTTDLGKRRNFTRIVFIAHKNVNATMSQNLMLCWQRITWLFPCHQTHLSAHTACSTLSVTGTLLLVVDVFNWWPCVCVTHNMRECNSLAQIVCHSPLSVGCLAFLVLWVPKVQWSYGITLHMLCDVRSPISETIKDLVFFKFCADVL